MNDLQPITSSGAAIAERAPSCLEIRPVPEPMQRRMLFAIVAVGVAAVYFFMLHSFWAPASPLIDQNAYEMGGRQFARSFTTGVRPANNFTYISGMYIRTPGGMYYPKYPLGMPILYACGLWIGQLAGARHGGTEWAMLLGPISATAAVFGAYAFLSRVVGSFAAILGALLLAFCPLSLILANQHWSHHPAIAFGIWGMFFLLVWWQNNGWWRGLLAGFLLGFAVLIRYTEALLFLPLIFVILNKLPYRRSPDIAWMSWLSWGIAAAVAIGMESKLPTGIHYRYLIIGAAVAVSYFAIALGGRLFARSGVFRKVETFFAGVLIVAFGLVISLSLPLLLRLGIGASIAAVAALAFTVCWSERRTLYQITWPMLGWLVPVLYLVVFNKIALGSWTGYDTTNESTGFTLQRLIDSWEYVFKLLDSTATFFLLPLAALGVGLAYRRSWRLATMLLLWVLPSTIAYCCYYWGLEVPTLFYLRFFLIALPPLAICAGLLFDEVLRHSDQSLSTGAETWDRRSAIAASVSILAGTGVGLIVHWCAPTLRGELVVLIGAVAALIVAAMFGAGRGVATPIAVGAMVAISVGLSLYDSVGSLDRDFAINENLYDVSINVLDRIPATDMKKTPLLFTETWGTINHLQFAGNFECYTSDAFTTQAYRPPRRAHDDQPDPNQNARRDYTASVYKDKNNTDLVTLQNDIVATALENGRRVFIVLPRSSIRFFVQTFVTPKLFTIKHSWRWTEPVEMSDAGKKALTNFGFFGSLMFAHPTPQEWEMDEIVLKTPTTSPAVRSR